MTRLPLLTAALALLPLAPGAAAATKSASSRPRGAKPVQATDTTPVDQILDRLEKRLLDEEADGLTFGEKMPPPLPEKRSGPAARIRGEKPVAIQAEPAATDELKSLGTLVTDLENQVDQLSNAIQKSKQGILDEAAVDNYVTLEAKLTDTDAAAVKNLTVKLDGFPVYELADAAGLWLPAKSVPIYAGPLQPGTHRLDLEARLVMRSKSGLPVNTDLYRFVNKTFDLTVGSGTSNSRWVIGIKPPEKLDGAPQASLDQSL